MRVSSVLITRYLEFELRSRYDPQTIWNTNPSQWERIINELKPIEEAHWDSPVIRVPLEPR